MTEAITGHRRFRFKWSVPRLYYAMLNPKSNKIQQNKSEFKIILEKYNTHLGIRFPASQISNYIHFRIVYSLTLCRVPCSKFAQFSLE